jgi:hypothetical protein
MGHASKPGATVNPYLSWAVLILGCGFLLWIILAADARLWQRKYERDDAQGDLERLRRLEEWRDALGRQYVKTLNERELDK